MRAGVFPELRIDSLRTEREYVVNAACGRRAFLSIERAAAQQLPLQFSILACTTLAIVKSET
jgi:hypothetical protein